MAKNDKAIRNLENQIAKLEADMKNALQKKKSGTQAFDVPKCIKAIADLKLDLKKLR
jgi:uncharacterized protein (UPF0335 family)